MLTYFSELCPPLRHHNFNNNVDGKLRNEEKIILNFRDGGQWTTSRHDRFTLGKSPPIHNDQMAGWFPETARALCEKVYHSYRE